MGKAMVCFDEHFARLDGLVVDPASGEPLQRFVLFHEDGRELARFVLPAAQGLTRWEILSAARDALKDARRRHRAPARMQLVA
jgi:hypothetical protein